MKEFKSLKDYSKYLNRQLETFKAKQIVALEVIGAAMEKESKHKIGHLQKGEGPFPNWKPLADSTKADKARLGYVFNSDFNPLLRTGEMRDSIHYKVISWQMLYVGSDSQIMVYQELGTMHIPPRSVLGLTAYQSLSMIESVFGQFMVNWFCGIKTKPRAKK